MTEIFLFIMPWREILRLAGRFNALQGRGCKGDEKQKRNLLKEDSFLSLLSDSNQRPRDYKSRALAN